MPRRSPFLFISLCAALLAVPCAASASDLHASDSTASRSITPKQALANAAKAKQGIGVDRGADVTVALRTLAEKLPQMSAADRRSAKRLLARPTIGEGNPQESTYEPGTTERSLCGTHFCVHWVDTTTDAPKAGDISGQPGVPDYVETMLGVFENVFNVENNSLGWPAAMADFQRGGNDLVDVYVKNIGDQGIFGYAAPDADQPGTQRGGDPRHLAAYLVMDNDYAEPAFTSRYPNFLEPLEVTAAHEYNHVLQFTLDANQDNWMFESTAVWMEDRVYDNINDYVSYLTPWAKDSLTPLTQASSPDGQTNIKIYGDAIFERWIDEHFGPDVIRRAWELSIDSGDFAPGAFDAALKEKSSSFFAAYSQLTAETAEWRTGSLFEEGQNWPDVQRLLNSAGQAEPIAPGDGGVTGPLDHTSFVLVPVDPAGQDHLTLSGALPRGTAGAIAIVGRSGNEVGGTPNVVLQALPNGGRATVTLDGATGLQRVTAVVINSDTGKKKFDQNTGDWNWTDDNEPVALRLNDATAPKVNSSSPKRNAKRVSTASKIKVAFSEYVDGLTSKTVKLTGPGSRSVKVRVSLTLGSGGGTVVKISPTKRLRRGTRYTVKLGAVTDVAGNGLASSQRTFRFTTAR